MKRIHISEPEKVILALRDEIRRSDESRYYHRLHGVLLVARGLSCTQIAMLLGDAPRTVAYWVHRFEKEGLAGLADGEKPGRPRRLGDEQLEQVRGALRMKPTDFGLNGNSWDGGKLSRFVANQWGVPLGVRQSQRLFRQLGFRLRKPGPEIDQANPGSQGESKKTERKRENGGNSSMGDQ
ncbi:MAG: helix-turn-helix domain-containing protein [Syntrophobacter sp.]